MQHTVTMARIHELREETAELNSAALHDACASWQQRERSCLLVVLIHLAEIAKRGLHLDRGFMHLGDYCQQHLGLSEGEAWTRVHVAKASIAHPELLLALGSGAISLAVAALLARHLTTENRDGLLQRCAGRSKRWVEEMLASIGKAVPQQRSSLRPQLVAAPQASIVLAVAAERTATSPHAAEPLAHHSPEQLSLDLESLPSAAAPEQRQLVHQLRCTISDETKAKLLRLAEVLGIVDPLNQLDHLITKATEIALHAKDPVLRQPTRKAADSKAPASAPPSAQVVQAVASVPSQIASAAPVARPRALPAALKRQVLARAGYQCEYVSAEGKRCCQKTGLEIDHQFPFAWGGEHEANNLLVLCRPHHRRKTEEQQGSWIRR